MFFTGQARIHAPCQRQARETSRSCVVIVADRERFCCKAPARDALEVISWVMAAGNVRQLNRATPALVKESGGTSARACEIARADRRTVVERGLPDAAHQNVSGPVAFLRG